MNIIVLEEHYSNGINSKFLSACMYVYVNVL